MPKVTIDGKAIEVEKGATIIKAAEKLGLFIPHYCYHPGLSVAGSCRMCLVGVQGAPKLQIACATQVADGMVVTTKTDEVKKARQAVLEFLLINHPLDCPICDQAGECLLQDYYMEYGLYDSRFLEDKVKKRKAVPVGPTIMLDTERCILCSRCVRFVDEITGTHEIGIFDRGDRSEIKVLPGRQIENKYSGNLADICPVGALTDRDFRFKCRVWYLRRQKSVCPGCARGCNIEIDYTSGRPHIADGKRVMRLKPRFNAEVNKWWICDYGRYGYKFIDDDSRIKGPVSVSNGQLKAVSWDEAIHRVASGLKGVIERNGAQSLGVIASAKCANEELYIARKLFADGLGLVNIDFRVVQKGDLYSDNFLIRADKNPNTKGAEAILKVDGAVAVQDQLQAARDGRLKALFIFGHDLFYLYGDLAREALARCDLLVFQGSNLNETGKAAHYILPSATYAELDGTFTNFEGRVQRVFKAFEPLGESLPGWQILARLGHELGISLSFAGAKEVFSELAREVGSFNGLSYEVIGDGGAMLRM